VTDLRKPHDCFFRGLFARPAVTWAMTCK
jgi:hypothetical protein